MKISVTIFTIGLVLSIVAVASAELRFAVAAQQPEKLTFKMEYHFFGPFWASSTYTASDGSTLRVNLVTYTSTAKAKKALAGQLKLARRINGRKDLLDESGKKMVEGIIITVDDGGSERTLFLRVVKTTLYTIDGASLRHIEEFRKLETQPNKSSDASGGGVFRKLIRIGIDNLLNEQRNPTKPCS
jgi:hypothetical protein